MTEAGSHNSSSYTRKVDRARTGLRGFMKSFISGGTFVACQAPVGACEYFTGINLSSVSAVFGLLAAVSLLTAGIFFGIMLCGLLMEPRSADIRPDLEKNLPEFVRMLAGAMSIFAVLVLCTVIVILTAAYIKSGNILTGSIALFAAAVLLFAISVVFALVKTIGTAGGEHNIRARIASIVIRGGSDRCEAGSFLGKAEIILGFIISPAIYILFQGEELISIISPFIGSDAADAAERVFSGGDALIHAMAFIILLFSAMFTVKALRTILETTRL